LEDGIIFMIHDLFPHKGEDIPKDDDDSIYDTGLIDNVTKPLYKGSKTNLLSTILLLMNLKVINGILNTFHIDIEVRYFL
jgi:hypothetical protein